MIGNRIVTIAIATIMISTVFGGCLSNPFKPEDNYDDELLLPEWKKGYYWEYAVKTAGRELSTTMVVSIDDDEYDYYVSSSTVNDAKMHAVLNHNPALGRVEKENLAVYENGETQTLFDFPLSDGKAWIFSLYGKEQFNAVVQDLVNNKATIVATSTDGAKIEYDYDEDYKWFTSFVYTENTGEIILEMNLASRGIDYSGNTYFCRGGDLYDEEFSGPDFSFYDTVYVNEGHERYGNWNYIVYYIESEMGSSGSGELILKDQEDTDVLVEAFSPGTTKSEAGTVLGESGNWTMEISLSGDSNVRLRIAGAIEYSYAV